MLLLLSATFTGAILSSYESALSKVAILTGVSFSAGRTGIVVYCGSVYAYYEHTLLRNSCHGTGDIYASAFVGALMRGNSPYDAARIAGDYTVGCIEYTATLPNHWYGAAFEPMLPSLIEALNN